MERTDPASSEDVKRMVHELGTTIQRTLAESPQIAHCLNRIKAEGYEVSLVLEATLGFSRTGSREAPEVSTFDFKVDKAERFPTRRAGFTPARAINDVWRGAGGTAFWNKTG